MIIAITGASGFIGREFADLARKRGHDVLELSRNLAEAGAVRWQLGDPLPENCLGADCIVHLASATLRAVTDMTSAARTDVEGTRRLLESVRQNRGQGRPMRFVFVSSQSSRADARNAYGRSKWQIEQMVDREDEVIVRPGLVYGDHSGSVAGLLQSLARLPVIPVIETPANIQPIHVRELAECLLSIVTRRDVHRLYQLGAVEPMTLLDAIRACAARSGRRAPAMVKMPASFVRLLARLLDGIVRPTPPLSERIEGLLGLRPMDTEASLKLLACEVAPFYKPQSAASSTLSKPSTG